MIALGWTVLALVFADEVLAVTALGAWGRLQTPGWLWVWLLPVAAIAAWALAASPRAPYAGPVRRPAVKVAVFGLASLALWDAGHAGLALGLAAFSVAVNGLAQLPSIAALPSGPRAPTRTGA